MKFGYIILNELNDKPINYIIFESKDDAISYIKNNNLKLCYVEQFDFYKKQWLTILNPYSIIQI